MIPSPRPQYRGRRLALTAGALLLPLALMAPASPAGATTTSPAGPAVGKDAAAALPDGPAAGRAEARRFPRPGNTGVPRDWQPRRTYYEDRIISRPGAVVQNIRLVEADLVINAPDVTVTNVEIVGGRITNFAGPTCQNGLLVTRTTFRRAADGDYGDAAIEAGGYVARRVAMLDVNEGFRVGGNSHECDRVRIANSYVRLKYPDNCSDWHGDGIQGYDGPRLTIRNVAIKMIEGPSCGGTAPFFYPAGQGNTSVDIDGLLVDGGGYPFRLGTPGTVKNLQIVRKSWGYGPIDVRCSALSSWDATIVTDRASGLAKVRRQPCNTNGGY